MSSSAWPHQAKLESLSVINSGQTDKDIVGSVACQHFADAGRPFTDVQQEPCGYRVKISAKAEYACIAMLELAANFESGELVRIRAIAGNHGIPSRFLVQILLQLKNAGLVASTRGAAGGYKLLKAPETVTLGEVISAIEGPLGRDQTSMTADSAAAQALLDVCNEIAEKQRQMLDSVTIADLQERVKRAPSDMYYI